MMMMVITMSEVNLGGRPSKLETLTKDDFRHIQRMASEGAVQEDIAKYLNISSRTLRRWLKQAFIEMDQKKSTNKTELAFMILMGQEMAPSRVDLKWKLLRTWTTTHANKNK